MNFFNDPGDSQESLPLGLEPTFMEMLGFKDRKDTIDWLGEDFYDQYEQELFDAWQNCWVQALELQKDPKASPRELDLANAVIAVMCKARKVPIVSHTFDVDGTPCICRNQLD
ncbi:MAG: hypothetical protein JSS66_07425 [Armatimonadetes bacterium]|nr:hypothetical protein [Armatimonadota bacterium]